MATIQSTLEFQDKMSATLNKIVQALENAAAKSTMAQTSLGMLETEQSQWKQTLDAANNSINKNSEAIKQSQEKYDEVTRSIEATKTELEKYKQTIDQNQAKIDKIAEMQEEFNKKLNETKQAADNAGTGLSSMQGKIITLASAFQLFGQIKGFIQSVNSKINEFVAYTQTQMQAEDQLSIITKQRMSLTDNEVRSLYNLAAAQQKVGVVGDEATIAAMSGLAAFTNEKKSIEALTPAMDNLAVKMYGYNVTAENMDMISKSLGKAMQGDVGALSRMGIKIDEVTKKRLMSLNEEQRAIELSKMITKVTGNMNEEMAKTPFGQIAQANNRLSDSYEKLGAALLPLQAKMTEIFSNVVEKIVNNLDTIVPLVTVALGVMTVGFITLNATAINAAVTSAAAWVTATAPIWIVISVIGAVSIAMNALGLTFQQQAKNIVISLNWVITALKNIWIGMQNTWIGATNFIRNFANNSTLILAKFFSWVLGKLSGIAKLMDTVLHTDLSGSVASISAATNKVKSNLSAKIAGNTTPYKNFEANDYYTNQAKAQSQMDKISGGLLKNRNLLGKAGGGLGGGNGLAGLTTNTSGGKALKTQNQGKIEMQEDDIELLHDLATRDFMLNYQQLTPQITIPGMVIHETADVDSIFEAFADNVTEVVNSSMQLVDGRAA